MENLSRCIYIVQSFHKSHVTHIVGQISSSNCYKFCTTLEVSQEEPSRTPGLYDLFTSWILSKGQICGKRCNGSELFNLLCHPTTSSHTGIWNSVRNLNKKTSDKSWPAYCLCKAEQSLGRKGDTPRKRHWIKQGKSINNWLVPVVGIFVMLSAHPEWGKLPIVLCMEYRMGGSLSRWQSSV